VEVVPVRLTCKTCHKRASCTRICKSVEKKLPRPERRPRCELNELDREVVWSIQDRLHLFPEPFQTVGRLYFRFGLDQKEIAERLFISQSSVYRILGRILKRKGGCE